MRKRLNQPTTEAQARREPPEDLGTHPRLPAMDPEGGVCVVVVNAGGLHELCDVQEVRDQHGNAQLAGQEQLTHR